MFRVCLQKHTHIYIYTCTHGEVSQSLYLVGYIQYFVSLSPLSVPQYSPCAAPRSRDPSFGHSGEKKLNFEISYTARENDADDIVPIDRSRTQTSANNIDLSRASHVACASTKDGDERNARRTRKPCGRGKRLEQLLFNCA